MSCQNDRVSVTTLPFHSRSFRLLRNTDRAGGIPNEVPTALHVLRDVEVRENRSFTYTVFSPKGREPSSGAILLFHGLNEKFWDKYEPWAEELALRSGKAVILFPIAFHMNRAPSEWSNPRMMSAVAEERKRTLSPVEASSFVNAALSTRLQLAPERFLWSGLETYYDVIQLIDEIRANRVPVVAPNAKIDLFGYSIGAFLVEMLMMENTRGLFSNSKAFLFCGGPTLAEMAPVSKYIMDSRANAALVSFYGEDFEEEIESNPPLKRLFERIQSLGTTFRSMLFPTQLREFRLERLATVGKRLAALLLKRDRVMPIEAARRTLVEGLSPFRAPTVEVIDFSFDYSHEQPFPRIRAAADEADRAIRSVMGHAVDHFA